MKIKKFAALMLALALVLVVALPASAIGANDVTWTTDGYNCRGYLRVDTNRASSNLSLTEIPSSPHLPPADMDSSMDGKVYYEGGDDYVPISGSGQLSCSWSATPDASIGSFSYGSCIYTVNSTSRSVSA